MKKLLVYIGALLLYNAVKADEFAIKDLSGGMNSYQSSNQIPDNAAELIQNFYTDVENTAVERSGYTKNDSTQLGGVKPITGLWSFTDIGGTEWMIEFSSRTFYKKSAGGTPTAFGLNATVAQIPDAAVNLGKIWFVNGTDDLWWFDGTSTGTVPMAPHGKLIEPWRQRIAIANITNAQSTIRFSLDGDGTSWTLGGNATDPFALLIGGSNDGQYVRCMKGSYLDSMIVGRKNDLWAIDGVAQDDVTTRNISTQIGCIEPATVQEVDGSLIFLSARGLEQMTNRSISPISEPIRNVTDSMVKNTISQRSNIQTLQADFVAGSNDNSVYIDTQTSPNDVQLTFPDSFASLRNGTSGTKLVWSTGTYAAGAGVGAITSDGSELVITHDGTVGAMRNYIYTANRMGSFTSGATYHFVINNLTQGIVKPLMRFAIANVAPPSGDPSSLGTPSFVASFGSSTTGAGYLVDGTDGTNSFASGDFTFPFFVDVYIRGSSASQLTINGSSVIYRGSGLSGMTGNKPYCYFIQFNASGGAAISKIDDFGVSPETGTFTSQLISIGNTISAWGPTSISDVQSGGSIAYQFGSTTTASIAAISNYASISNGATPSVSTAPYAGFRATFSNTIATATVKLSEFITTWAEGGAIPAPVSTVYDRRYWISYTTSTASAPYLDSIFVYQRNKSFISLSGIYAASFAIWRDNMYFGNSNSTGYSYKFDVGNNDDGANITSIIRTKSYNFNFPQTRKDIRQTYCTYLGNSSYSGIFSLGYSMDRYGIDYSLGSALLSEGTGLTSIKFPFPLSQITQGKELQFVLNKTGTGDRLKLYSFITTYELKEEP